MRIHWKVLPQGYKLWKDVLHSLGEHFKLAVEVLFLQLLRCCENVNGEHSQGRVWGWGIWKNTNIFNSTFPQLFQLWDYKYIELNVIEKNKELCYPEGHKVKELSVPTPAQTVRDRGGQACFGDETCTNQTTATSDKKLVSALRAKVKEVTVPREHESTKSQQPPTSLSWKLATESCCQDVLGNPDSPNTKCSIFYRQTLHSLEPTNPWILQVTPIFKHIFLYKFPIHWQVFVKKWVKSSNRYKHLNHVLIKLLLVSLT